MKGSEDILEEIMIWNNDYGYRINIMHPQIKPLYDRFKKWKGVPDWCPLSDNERFEFEEYILKNIKNREKNA